MYVYVCVCVSKCGPVHLLEGVCRGQGQGKRDATETKQPRNEPANQQAGLGLGPYENTDYLKSLPLGGEQDWLVELAGGA